MASQALSTDYPSIQLQSIPPHTRLSQLIPFLQELPGLIQVHNFHSASRPGLKNLNLVFEPGTDVCQVLGMGDLLRAPITIDHYQIFAVRVPDNEIPKTKVVATMIDQGPDPKYWRWDIHTRRYLEVDEAELAPICCCVCCEELPDTYPFATPCLRCHQAQCYSCLRTQFSYALENYEQFPARCCGTMFHPEVAKAILDTKLYEAYFARFEEWLDQDKTYCPVPTCSAPIPSRKIRMRGDGRIECHKCGVRICVQCKELDHPNQSCTINQGKTEMLGSLKQFGYKQCPRCDMAVAKLYGCNHVQCKCGAHWCWDCRRNMSECAVNPCDGNEEYRNDDDQDTNVPNPVANENNPAVAAAMAPNDEDTNAINTQQVIEQPNLGAQEITLSIRLATEAEPPVNLDDPVAADRDAFQFEYDDEPLDDDPLDTWGCYHDFVRFRVDRVPRYWMTAFEPWWFDRDQRKVSCVRCWKTATVMPSGEELSKMTAWEIQCSEEARDSTSWCHRCGVVVCHECEMALAWERGA